MTESGRRELNATIIIVRQYVTISNDVVPEKRFLVFYIGQR